MARACHARIQPPQLTRKGDSHAARTASSASVLSVVGRPAWCRSAWGGAAAGSGAAQRCSTALQHSVAAQRAERGGQARQVQERLGGVQQQGGALLCLHMVCTPSSTPFQTHTHLEGPLPGKCPGCRGPGM